MFANRTLHPEQDWKLTDRAALADLTDTIPSRGSAWYIARHKL
jgi:hypothetical protein